MESRSVKHRHSLRIEERIRNTPPLLDAGAFSCLPDEIILIMLFHFSDAASLGRLAVTCRRLARIVSDPTLQTAAMTAFAVRIRFAKRRNRILAMVLPNIGLRRYHGLYSCLRHHVLLETRMYANGRRHGPSQEGGYNGMIVRSLSEWQNGLRHGITQEFDCDGNLRSKTPFCHGRPHGTGTYVFWLCLRKYILTAEFDHGNVLELRIEYSNPFSTQVVTLRRNSNGRFLGSVELADGSVTTLSIPPPRTNTWDKWIKIVQQEVWQSIFGAG